MFVRSELPDGLTTAGRERPMYLGCPNAIAPGIGGISRQQRVSTNGQQAGAAPLHSSDWAVARGGAATRTTWARAAPFLKSAGPGSYEATEAGHTFARWRCPRGTGSCAQRYRRAGKGRQYRTGADCRRK